MSTYAQERPIAGKTITIDCVTNWPSFAALAAEWTDLLTRSRSDCVFLSHEWLSGWWKHLSDGRELHILTARADGRLVGILPLAIRPRQVGRMMPKVLEFLGSGIVGSDYLDAIVDQACEHESLEAFARALSGSGFMIQFGQLRESGSLAEEIASRLGRAAWKASNATINVCPFIPLSGYSWESYLSELGSSQRYNFQRRLKSLEKTGEFRLETATAADCVRSLDVLIELHRKRWGTRTELSEAFQTESITAFHREFVQAAADRGWLRLLSLWIANRPVAALYGLRYGGTFSFYQSGFDPEFAKKSVGLVMMGLAIRSAIEEGADEYDLLHGDEEYKFHWTQKSKELRRVELFPPRARGFLYRHAITANRAARRLARRMLIRA
jgi:CelD/BcsL family acetyltransferase involved in cellulose biosynthesis